MLKVPNDALWFWGAIKDFVSEGMFDKDPNARRSFFKDKLPDQTHTSVLLMRYHRFPGSCFGARMEPRVARAITIEFFTQTRATYLNATAAW
jgi:hypothetical protein